MLRPGDVVVDVGANIGYVSCLAALQVGPSGRVVAVEPADDNLAVLRANVRRNRLDNVEVIAAAAGRQADTRDLFMRGGCSAVNSLYPRSCYAEVTRVVPVPVVALDDLVGAANLVKIDVEGAELDVLGGMRRLLNAPGMQVLVEWHPLLQRATGRGTLELPEFLLDSGLSMEVVDDLGWSDVDWRRLPAMALTLERKGRPVELFARRPG